MRILHWLIKGELRNLKSNPQLVTLPTFFLHPPYCQFMTKLEHYFFTAAVK